LALAEELGDPARIMTVKSSLGSARILTRQADRAQSNLEEALELAQQGDHAALPVRVPDGEQRYLEGLEVAREQALVVDREPEVARDLSIEKHGQNARFGHPPIGDALGRADHPVPTLLVRVDVAGRSLAYTADTGTGCDLVGLAAGANTLLAEATFQGTDKPAPHHLTAAEAGTIAHDAGVERLILTHILPSLDRTQSIEEAAARFGGDVMAAAPGLEVLI